MSAWALGTVLGILSLAVPPRAGAAAPGSPPHVSAGDCNSGMARFGALRLPPGWSYGSMAATQARRQSLAQIEDIEKLAPVLYRSSSRLHSSSAVAELSSVFRRFLGDEGVVVRPLSPVETLYFSPKTGFEVIDDLVQRRLVISSVHPQGGREYFRADGTSLGARIDRRTEISYGRSAESLTGSFDLDLAFTRGLAREYALRIEGATAIHLRSEGLHHLWERHTLREGISRFLGDDTSALRVHPSNFKAYIHRPDKNLVIFDDPEGQYFRAGRWVNGEFQALDWMGAPVEQNSRGQARSHFYYGDGENPRASIEDAVNAIRSGQRLPPIPRPAAVPAR